MSTAIAVIWILVNIVTVSLLLVYWIKFKKAVYYLLLVGFFVLPGLENFISSSAFKDWFFEEELQEGHLEVYVTTIYVYSLIQAVLILVISLRIIKYIQGLRFRSIIVENNGQDRRSQPVAGGDATR